MENFSVYDLVHSLLGGIEPIGETNYDNKCLANITKYEELILLLCDDMLCCLQYRNNHEASMKAIGNYATKVCDRIKERIDYDERLL